jgi:hypothetical protein
MILILPTLGIAIIAPLAQTVPEQFSAEVPAPGPLAEISCKRSHVPDLRNPYLAGGLDQKWEFFSDQARR